jgi:hypothetical protein
MPCTVARLPKCQVVQGRGMFRSPKPGGRECFVWPAQQLFDLWHD